MDKCAKCDSKALPGAETYTGKPACYYHEDKISYLERVGRDKMPKLTQICARCGEYVAEKDVTSNGDDWRREFVHVNEYGATLYREHAVVLTR